jgi:hypothetical protein
MTKTKVFLVTAFLVVVAGLYFYVYRDAFQKPVIQIFHTFRPRSMAIRRRGANQPAQNPGNTISFGMGQQYRLTSIRVVVLEEFKTNKYAHPIWELTTKSNSVPTMGFFYGQAIPGMEPVAKGVKPDPLATNVEYRMFVEAGNIKGQHDFMLSETNFVQQ